MGETSAIYVLLWSIVTSIHMPTIPYSSNDCEINLANWGEKLMELLQGMRKTRITKCEICENREAFNNGLCEDCAEGITRLVRIKLPEDEQYFTAAASTT
jgi:hypothetical protein